MLIIIQCGKHDMHNVNKMLRIEEQGIVKSTWEATEDFLIGGFLT